MSIYRPLLLLFAIGTGVSMLFFSGCTTCAPRTTYVQDNSSISARNNSCTTVRFPENGTVIQRGQTAVNSATGTNSVSGTNSATGTNVTSFPSISNSLVAQTPRSTQTTSTVNSTLPPQQSELSKVARSAMDQKPLDTIERSKDEGYLVPQKVGNQVVNAPPRSRQSIVDKEKTEKELEVRYQEWEQTQKKNKKGERNVPEYLRPLTDDRAVFNDPDSPFVQEERQNNDRRFVRQVTAADLNLMSQISSRKELMDWEKEMEMPIDWSKYSAKTLWSKWRDWLGMGPNEKEAIALMKQACEKHMLYENTKETKHLFEAAKLYEKAGKKWTDSILEEDALFYAGECLFFANSYDSAMRHYKMLVSKYSNSILKKAAIERLYYIGCYWVQCSETETSVMNLTNKQKPKMTSTFSGAKKAFEAIFMNDTSDDGRAPDALMALANAYMRRGVEQGDASFESAAQYYRQLYEFYPTCKHADKAYQFTIISLHQSYRGPLYDTRPLKQAEEIAETAKRIGKGDLLVINAELAKIKEEQARHLWIRGQYYEKRGYYASARSYYNQLSKEFPGSEYTQQAIARYLQIKDMPAEADTFSWVRPVMPFLPENNSEYFEDRPDRLIQVAEGNQQNPSTENASNALQFRDLDKKENQSENNKKLF